MSNGWRWILGRDAGQAGERFCVELEQWAERQPPREFSGIALTGGESARVFYAAWAEAFNTRFSPILRERLRSRAHYFWSDERFVPHSSAESNFHLAAEILLQPRACQHIHPAPVDGRGAECAREYARQIRQLLPAPAGLPQFDLVLLGLGEDGHTASLFPHRDPYQDDELLVRFVNASADHPHDRLTFTPALINAAREVWFLALGRDKQPAVRQLYERRAQPKEIPALVADPARTAVSFFLDLDAAGALAPQLVPDTEPA